MAELAAAFAASLELVAGKGDPTGPVYERLFERHPETQRLFVGDTTGQARGQMLSMVLETLADLAEGKAWPANMIRAERVNHDQLGVDDAVFGAFFAIVHDTFRGIGGPDWTPAMDEAWSGLLRLADVR